MISHMLQQVGRPVNRPMVKSWHKHLYCAAVRLCKCAATEVAEGGAARWYCDGTLMVTHKDDIVTVTMASDEGGMAVQVTLDGVTVEPTNDQYLVDVYRMERGHAPSVYIHGPWEDRLTALAANAWRA